jgi:flagellar motor switch/type III secretory pathway protein FliN
METEHPKTASEQTAGDHFNGQDAWQDVIGLPCFLSVALPITGFRVRDLLELEVETVLNTRCNTNDPVPVWVNSVQIGEAEFDVFGTRLAVRISELG